MIEKKKSKSQRVYINEQTNFDGLSYDELCYGYDKNKEPDYRKRDSNLYANSYMDGYNYDDWN